MRPGFLLSSAACVLAATPGSADEFKNPPVIEVRPPGGDLTIRARRGTAVVPGLGPVEQVYGYEVRQGASRDQIANEIASKHGADYTPETAAGHKRSSLFQPACSDRLELPAGGSGEP